MKKNASNSLNGFQFDFVSSKKKFPWDGMRVTVTEKEFKVIITSDVLRKEAMEKVLLSMIHK